MIIIDNQALLFIIDKVSFSLVHNLADRWRRINFCFDLELGLADAQDTSDTLGTG